ncbi:MAG: UvrD-helicase domain-containing protein [Coriobacteriia bacterium]|nr:UvrD-helicase domain-containing protein [Coriobacteriia bacterium]
MTLPSLNTQQERAASRLAGDTFVSAGAGSGKTRVLAERFVRVVLDAEERGESAAEALRRILLITFTDKAAGELGERVRLVLLDRGRHDLAKSVDEAWISTIHGFCARIVRRHALELGIDPGFAVLVDPQTGVVRQQSFERSARALAGTDPGVAELLGTHGVASVRDAVARGLDQVRAMGRDPERLEVPEGRDCLTALKQARIELEGLLDEYVGLRPLKVIVRNTDLLVDIVPHLGTLLEASRADGGATLPTEIVALARAYPFKPANAAKGPEKDMTARLMESFEELLSAGVEELSARHAEGFKRLIAAYGAAYTDAKAALGALDFEDMQLLAAQLFEEHPETARRYAARFLTAMVDEFQDTNELQLRVVEPITEGRLCVVGDDKQSIYGFRFADVDVFHGRRSAQESSDSDGACSLSVNYRSHGDLLEAINSIFGREPFFPGDFLCLEPGRTSGWVVPLPEGASRTEVVLVERRGWEGVHAREVEAAALARRIGALVAAGTSPGDIVVLMRQMTQARTYIRALRAQGLDVSAESSGGFFSSPEIADVRALLRTLANPSDGEAVVALLAGGLGGVSDDGLFLLARATESREGLWDAVARATALELAVSDTARCTLVHATITDLRARQGRDRLADILLDAAAALAPGGGCFAHDGAWANLRKAARIAGEFERVAQADPAAFLRHLDDREAFVKREASASVASEAGSAIRVMTVHAAKGLEFPVVAVADLGHAPKRDSDTLAVVKHDSRARAVARLPKSFGDDLPLSSSYTDALLAQADRAALEEKRVFYVACTRAEELLILSGVSDLDKAPGATLAIDLVRRSLGVVADGACDVPGCTVSIHTPDDPDAVDLLPETRASSSGPEGPDAGALCDPKPVVRAVLAMAPPADLSYTALDVYERCPYRFYAERVVGITSLDGAGGGGGPRGLGLAVHGALQLLAGGTEPDDERLKALARYHRLDADETLRLADAVAAFRNSPAAALAAGRGAPEVRFVASAGGGVLVGTLDLLVRDGDVATVIDYKTGASELAASDARDRFVRQAEVYALALLRSGCRRVDVRFVEVERSARETTFSFTPRDADSIEARVAAVIAGIAGERFPRLRRFDANACSDCCVSGSLCPIVHPHTKRTRRGTS